MSQDVPDPTEREPASVPDARPASPRKHRTPMPRERIATLLVDDHPVVRNGLAAALGSIPDIHVVGQAGGGREAMELTRKMQPRVVVLDFSMADMDGTQVVTKLREQHPDVGVVMFSVHENHHYARQALKAGARAYVVKGDSLDEVIEAVRMVAAGHVYITQRLLPALADGLQSGATGLEGLSPREFELVRCRVRGMTLKGTAEHMHVSESTASTYQQRVLEKLKLENVAQLIRFALDHDIDG